MHVADKSRCFYRSTTCEQFRRQTTRHRYAACSRKHDHSLRETIPQAAYSAFFVTDWPAIFPDGGPLIGHGLIGNRDKRRRCRGGRIYSGGRRRCAGRLDSRRRLYCTAGGKVTAVHDGSTAGDDAMEKYGSIILTARKDSCLLRITTKLLEYVKKLQRGLEVESSSRPSRRDGSRRSSRRPHRNSSGSWKFFT